jgi:hypothetical protein
MISGVTAGASTQSAVCVGLRRSTRAVRSNTGWMFLTAAMVNSITGIVAPRLMRTAEQELPLPKFKEARGPNGVILQGVLLCPEACYEWGANGTAEQKQPRSGSKWKTAHVIKTQADSADRCGLCCFANFIVRRAIHKLFLPRSSSRRALPRSFFHSMRPHFHPRFVPQRHSRLRHLNSARICVVDWRARSPSWSMARFGQATQRSDIVGTQSRTLLSNQTLT